MTPVTEAPIWGEGVRLLRGVRGLTQEQLAEKAQTTQASISRIELGSRRIGDDLRVRIARALDTEPHRLFPYLDEHGNVA